ncbi:MAG: hypothetical protein ACI4V1_09695 [Eubacteriales bacterium]
MQKHPEGPASAGGLSERLREWRLGLSIDGESVTKGVVCGLLILFFSLVQTTLFTRFRPFGAVPDLVLPLVIAIAMTEREKWGSVCGLIGAFIIESLGGSRLTLLPLLYMPAGYLCGITTVYYFRDSFAVRALYTGVSSLARALFTLIALTATVAELSILSAFTHAVLPELAANLLFAALPHAAACLALRPFNKTRDAKVHKE